MTKTMTLTEKKTSLRDAFTDILPTPRNLDGNKKVIKVYRKFLLPSQNHKLHKANLPSLMKILHHKPQLPDT